MDPGSFWILANILYWLAWMNLLLGMSNALPLFPLDGGLLFRDFSASIALAPAPRLGRGPPRPVRRAGRSPLLVVVLALLVWQFIGPRL